MLVTFEGPDGVGKSTQARLLAANLEQRGYQVTFVREPGGTLLGEGIRTLLIDSPKLDPQTQLLLFNASRSHLVRTVIRPALEKGGIVICDRFIDSSIVYQGAAGIPIDKIRQMNHFATDGLMPDLTFTYILHPDEAQRRDRGEFNVHSSAWDQFNIYRDLASEDPARWRVLSGYLSREELAFQALNLLSMHPKFAQVQKEVV